MSRNPFFAIAMMLLPAHIASASATPPRWHQGFEIGVGCNDPVTSIASLGDGRYVVSGEFSNCGDVVVPGLAIFDPATGVWSEFPQSPLAAAEYPKSVHASGSDVVVVSTYGGVSWWNGSSWRGLGPSAESASAVIFNGQIHLAGYFPQAAHPGFRVIRWSGSEWIPLDATLDGSEFDDVITSLAVYDGDLYAAGYFRSIEGGPTVAASRIARWTGTAWQPLGSDGGNGIGGAIPGIALGIHAMAVWDDALYVVGDFTSTNEGATSGAISTARIARWDGAQWSAVGSGIQDEAARAISGSSAGLFVGGTFTNAGGVTVEGLARWNGLEWSAVPGAPSYRLDEILSLSQGTRGVIVGGRYGIVRGADPSPLVVNHVSEWDGAEWTTFGTDVGNGLNGPVSAITRFRGDLYAGGAFTSAGGKPARNIARWDGSEWHPLGSASSNGFDDYVLSFATMDDTLVIGGRFENGYNPSGTIEAHLIATWDGDVIDALGSDMPANGRVNALLWSPPNLYAAGWINGPNPGDPSGIARWDGVQWSPMGTPPFPGVLGGANTIALFDGQLHVGGYLSAARGADGTLLSLNRLARWSGSDWQAVGVGNGNGVSLESPFPSAVHALEPDGNGLYVAGYFNVVNTVPPDIIEQSAPRGASKSLSANVLGTSGTTYAKGVVRWTGESWEPLGALGAGPNDAVYALSITREGVYAGGAFRSVRDPPVSVPAKSLALWKQQQWIDIGANMQGAPATVFALASDSRRGLYAAGSFGSAGGAPAAHFTYYDADPDTIFVSDFER